MQNAIQKTMELKYSGTTDESKKAKTKDKFIQCIMIDIMNSCQNGYTIEKKEFEKFISKVLSSMTNDSIEAETMGVIEVFSTLQSEFEELTVIDKSVCFIFYLVVFQTTFDSIFFHKNC